MPVLALATAAPSAAVGQPAILASRADLAPQADVTKAGAVGVAPGIAILDLDSRRSFLGARNGEASAPVMSADGDHAIWQYNNYHGAFGLVWRDLGTGQTIVQQGLWPYGTDISGDGTYVVYASEAETARSGLITGMDVWLWDTQTGQRMLVNRTAAGKVGEDGVVRGLHISSDGDYVVFASTSQLLAPAGYKMCASCNDAPSYVYLYDRLTKTLRAVPKKGAFGTAPSLGYPVISGNGDIVAFHVGNDVDVWSTVTNKVWPVAFQKNVGLTDGNSLAVSANGGVIANNGPGGIGVVQLGAAAGTYRLQWAYYDKTGPAEFPSVALSSDGSVLAFFGAQGQAGWGHWPLWRVELPRGLMQLLRPPPVASGLQLEPAVSGIGGQQVSMSANGAQVAALACSLKLASARAQGCPLRADVYRWTQ
jgi:Tol biopolymer transport system component